MYGSTNAYSRALTLLEAQIYRAAAVPMNMAPPLWAVADRNPAIVRGPEIRAQPAPTYEWNTKLGPLASDIWS